MFKALFIIVMTAPKETGMNWLETYIHSYTYKERSVSMSQ